MHGSGTLTFKDGEKLSGTWKNGKKDGVFTKTTKNGNEVKVKYVNDKLVK